MKKVYMYLVFILLSHSVIGQEMMMAKQVLDRDALASLTSIETKKLLLSKDLEIKSLKEKILAISGSDKVNSKDKDSLWNQLSEAMVKISGLEASNQTLRQKLQHYEANAFPTSVILADDKVKVTDREFAAKFKLNKAGRIKVQLFKEGSRTPDEIFISEFQTVSLVKFKKLTENTKYNVRVSVIDYEEKERKPILDFQQNSKLQFTTLNPSDEPSFSVTKSSVGPRSIVVQLQPNNDIKCSLEYTCSTNIIGDNGETNPIKVKSIEINRDEFGFPTELNTKQTIIVDQLNPVTTYAIKVIAYNEYNKPFYKTLTFTTDVEKPELQFSGGINFDFNVFETKIAWKPSTLPKKALVRMYLPSNPGLSILSEPLRVNDSLVSKFNYNQITSLLNGNQKNNPPLIVLQMEDDFGKIKETQFIVKVSVPTTEQIMNSGLPEERQKEITKAVEKTIDDEKKTGKINWGNLIKIGVPIILSVL